MNQDYIRLRIKEIRALIGDFRFKQAFEKLEEFIAEMEGEEVEGEDERDLLNQLLLLKARYNSVVKAQREGVQENELEMNKITKSLIQLTNMVNEIGLNDPEKFKPDPDKIPTVLPGEEEDNDKDKEEIVAYMAVASNPSEQITYPETTGNNNTSASQPSQKEKTLFSVSESEDGSINIKFNGIVKVLMGILLVAGIFYFGRACNGRGGPAPPPPPPEKVDSTLLEPPPAKVALCPSCGDIKLNNSSSSEMASYLSDPESTYPKRFDFRELAFAKNGASLKSRGKKALDDLVVLLKEADDVMIDVYGFIGKKEKSDYQGSKEVSLDDVRARSVYDYLKSRGIADSRISFQGEGTADGEERIMIQINK